MDENALKRFFDKYIANEYTEEVHMEEEKMQEENDEDEFFRLLPDELLLYYDPRQENQRETADMCNPTSSSSSRSRHCISKNPLGKTCRPDPLADLYPPTHPVPPEGFYRAGFTVKISNTLSTANLGCKLDLNFIARNIWNVEWNPKTLYKLTLTFRKPKATIFVFNSGRVVCLGCKSLEESMVATRRCARKIQKLGFPVTFKNFKIRSIAASTRIAPLQLAQLVLAHKKACSYEPELFPALFYKKIRGISVTIGNNGGISLIGHIKLGLQLLSQDPPN